MKIQLLILWIARSLQRRQRWKEVSPGKQVGYDVDTRWNSTYIMIADAMIADTLREQKELGQFVWMHPEVNALQLTDIQIQDDLKGESSQHHTYTPRAMVETAEKLMKPYKLTYQYCDWSSNYTVSLYQHLNDLYVDTELR